MGKCVKCSRETKNQYVCYTAEVAEQHHDVLYENVTTKTKFINIEKREEYLCNHCIISTSGAGCFTIVGAVLFVISLVVILTTRGAVNAADYGIVGVLICVVSLISIFIGLGSINSKKKMCNNDERHDGGEFAIDTYYQAQGYKHIFGVLQAGDMVVMSKESYKELQLTY